MQQLVAPIALYPDELVAEVLATATYPTQVVEADRWLQGNKNLQGKKDVLVLYTDGLLDAVNRNGEQFGEERFREAVRSSLSIVRPRFAEKSWISWTHSVLKVLGGMTSR